MEETEREIFGVATASLRRRLRVLYRFAVSRRLGILKTPIGGGFRVQRASFRAIGMGGAYLLLRYLLNRHQTDMLNMFRTYPFTSTTLSEVHKLLHGYGLTIALRDLYLSKPEDARCVYRCKHCSACGVHMCTKKVAKNARQCTRLSECEMYQHAIQLGVFLYNDVGCVSSRRSSE